MKIELDKKRKLYIFVGIIMFVILESLLILGLNIKWNKEIKIVSAIVFLMIIPYLFLKRYSEINKHKYYENISFDSIDFILIEDDVRELCKKFKIDNIKFKVEKDDINNVLVKMDDNDIYEVIVFQGFLEVLKDINKIYGSNIKEMFLVTIGHELGHIYYNDLKNYTKRVRWSCIIYMLFIYGSVFLLIINMEVFRFISIMLLFFSWFVGDVMIDIRYWKQIAEIKADRLAVDRCENGRKAFIDIWGNEKKFKEDKLKIKKIEKSNIIYKYYKRYIENESHPSMERRVYLVKNRSKWKWWEYIEHALLIRKWRFSGKGWNGR